LCRLRKLSNIVSAKKELFEVIYAK
jgi:hypothetical protein